MGPVEVVRRFWERIEARDWDAVGVLLAEDVVFDWRDSGERFRGRDKPRRSMRRLNLPGR